MNNFNTPQSCLYNFTNPFFVTLGPKCPYFKMAKRDTILYGLQGHTLFCDPKWCKNKSHDLLIKKGMCTKNSSDNHNVPGWHKLPFTIENKH